MRGDTIQVEPTERFVVAGKRTLALEDVDFHLRLHIAGGGENLALASWDRGIALDERGGDAAQSFHRECQRGDIQQQDIFDFTAQDTRLDGSADCDNLIGIDAFVRVFVEELADCILDSRHAGHPTDQDDFVDLRGSTLASFIASRTGLSERSIRSPVSCSSLARVNGMHKVARPARIGSDIRQVDLGLHHG